jgi:hypothetical protein
MPAIAKSSGNRTQPVQTGMLTRSWPANRRACKARRARDRDVARGLRRAWSKGDRAGSENEARALSDNERAHQGHAKMIAPQLPFHWLRWFVTASNTPRAISTPSPNGPPISIASISSFLVSGVSTSYALGKRRDWGRKSSNSSASKPPPIRCANSSGAGPAHRDRAGYLSARGADAGGAWRLSEG